MPRSLYCDDALPCTRNGLAASVDGHLMPENMMPRGNPATCSPDVTVMHFKNADGSPMTVSLGQYGASDRWKLIADVNTPSGFRWERIP